MNFKLAILFGLLITSPIMSNAQGQISRTKPIPNKPTRKTTGNIDGHGWVDLGLSSGTKWATCNIGANTPEEVGKYFSWGENKEKKVYTPDNTLTIEREIFDGYYKTVENYNIAEVLWGKKWDMPKHNQFLELTTECHIDSITINHTDCYVFSGPNGNKLTLPKTGYKDGNELKNNNESHYWMGDVHFKDNETVAKIASSYRFPNEGKYSAYDEWTYLGMCVRPVINWYYDNK